MISEDLKSLNGQLVTVVRPFFGSQSESFAGELKVLTDIYHFVSGHSAMIFKLDDVVSVEIPSLEHPAIIRLKGPSYYGACLTA
jgi:hypothetical protein